MKTPKSPKRPKNPPTPPAPSPALHGASPYRDQIESAFTYHRPDEAGAGVCQGIRDQCKAIALEVAGVLPACRETSLALTHLEEFMSFAIAAVVRKRPAAVA